jgi:hypothetical protein
MSIFADGKDFCLLANGWGYVCTVNQVDATVSQIYLF